MNFELLVCVVAGEPGQQDEGPDHPAAAGPLSHLSLACTETHLLAPGHRLLSPLSSVQHLSLPILRGWLEACWLTCTLEEYNCPLDSVCSNLNEVNIVWNVRCSDWYQCASPTSSPDPRSMQSNMRLFFFLNQDPEKTNMKIARMFLCGFCAANYFSCPWEFRINSEAVDQIRRSSYCNH